MPNSSVRPWIVKEIGSDDNKLSEAEKEIVSLCVDAYLQKNDDITTDVVFSWYKDEPIDQDKLRKIIIDRIHFKLAAKEDKEKSGNSVNVRQLAIILSPVLLFSSSQFFPRL